MSREADLQRQVHHLRLQLAHAEVKAAANYKLIAIVAAAVTVWIWATMSTALEAGADVGVHGLLIVVLPIIGILWWTAKRHHERVEERVARAVEEARTAGYFVELTDDFVHISGPRERTVD